MLLAIRLRVRCAIAELWRSVSVSYEGNSIFFSHRDSRMSSLSFGDSFDDIEEPAPLDLSNGSGQHQLQPGSEPSGGRERESCLFVHLREAPTIRQHA